VDSNLKKSFLIVSALDLATLTAPSIRLLAIARALSETDVRVHWIVNNKPAPENIINDSRYAKIGFVSTNPTIYYNPFRKQLNFFSRLIAILSLPRLVNAISLNTAIKGAYMVGKNISELLLTETLLHQAGIKVYYERTESPFLGINSKLSIRWFSTIIFFNIFIPKLDGVFVISTALKELFIQHTPKNKCPGIRILNMVVEPDRVQRSLRSGSSLKNTSRDIVYVGSMYGDKDGVNILVEAFIMISGDYPDIRLLLIGDSSDREKLKEVLDLIRGKQCADRIVFTGLLGREETYTKLSSAYCLALSRPDNTQAKYGFPNKLGEYLATGRPVVITSVGDIPLYLTDGVNAYISMPDSVSSFASKLRDCLDDCSKAAEIGFKGRDLTKTTFNYYQTVKRELYDPYICCESI